MSSDPPDHASRINALRAGFVEGLGLHFTKATRDEVLATVAVGPHLHQPYGLVHGGVYAAVAETLCSVGAALVAAERGQNAVGLENQTTFLRAVRSGTLHARATPLSRGRRSQVWTTDITDDEGRLVAQGRVRMLCLEEGASAGGETVELQGATKTGS